MLLAVFGNLFLIGVVAPWLGAPALAAPVRRPSRGRPPKAQLEVLADRVGTGLLLAGVVGVLAAGLAARPVVVSETEDTERNAKAFRAFDPALQRPGADPQPGDGQHHPPARGLLPHLRGPRRSPALLLRLHRHGPRPRPGAARRERGAELGLPRVLKRHERAAGPYLEHLDLVRTRPQRVVGDHEGEVLGGAEAQAEAAAGARIRPFTATARSRSSPGAPPSSGPVTRVGSSSVCGSTLCSIPVAANVGLEPARPPHTARPPACGPGARDAGPTRCTAAQGSPKRRRLSAPVRKRAARSFPHRAGAAAPARRARCRGSG